MKDVLMNHLVTSVYVTILAVIAYLIGTYEWMDAQKFLTLLALYYSIYGLDLLGLLYDYDDDEP